MLTSYELRSLSFKPIDVDYALILSFPKDGDYAHIGGRILNWSEIKEEDFRLKKVIEAIKSEVYKLKLLHKNYCTIT